jgi:hypothetical protein
MHVSDPLTVTSYAVADRQEGLEGCKPAKNPFSCRGRGTKKVFGEASLPRLSITA